MITQQQVDTFLEVARTQPDKRWKTGFPEYTDLAKMKGLYWETMFPVDQPESLINRCCVLHWVTLKTNDRKPLPFQVRRKIAIINDAARTRTEALGEIERYLRGRVRDDEFVSTTVL